MSETIIIFTLDGVNLTVQCSPEDKMRDICQRYAAKVQIPLNSLIFLYNGTQLNLDLKFKEQANSIDKNNNEMKVLVYKHEFDNFICPNCGEIIQINTEKIDDLILSNDNINDTINGIKINIDNIIKTSTINSMNIQLKNINTLLNLINEDIKKNTEKLKNLLNDNNEFQNKNIISGILDIKLNELLIILFYLILILHLE